MNILITGGAGFIGSNLAESLLQDDRVNLVRILDNFATGHKHSLAHLAANTKLEIVEGDIRNADDCHHACAGINAISHQAALGSVPRSIADPRTSHNVNVNGFVNMLEAARAAGIRRIVYASSSSVYGDLPDSPKVETRVGKLLSPYAATKMANELYAQAWFKSYNMQLIGLRYFNVFGKQQDPNGAYAAVIPLFIKSALTHTCPQINGDGSITRDFTPVANVIQANTNAMLMDRDDPFHEVVNIACGATTSLNDLWYMIAGITGTSAVPAYGPVRPGDILQSLADISAARNILAYTPFTELEAAMRETVSWYEEAIFRSAAIT